MSEATGRSSYSIIGEWQVSFQQHRFINSAMSGQRLLDVPVTASLASGEYVFSTTSFH